MGYETESFTGTGSLSGSLYIDRRRIEVLKSPILYVDLAGSPLCSYGARSSPGGSDTGTGAGSDGLALGVFCVERTGGLEVQASAPITFVPRGDDKSYR